MNKDLYYVAGLLEGEGYFDPGVRLCVNCSMTDLDPLERLVKSCGGTIHQLKKKTITGKLVYRWYLGRRGGAIKLVKEIRHLMSKRRCESIDRMIEKDSETTNFNWSGVPIHGTSVAYNQHKCRCHPCKENESLYRKNLKTKRLLISNKGDLCHFTLSRTPNQKL